MDRDGQYRCKIQLVIIGGESGHSARPCKVDWIRSIVRQCADAKVPAFVKQLGSHCLEKWEDGFDGKRVKGFPTWPKHLRAEGRVDGDPCGFGVGGYSDTARIHFRDRAGGDPSEWPEDVRVRQFPQDQRGASK